MPFSVDPLRLPGPWAVGADGRPDTTALLQRLRALSPGVLPLQAACSRGGIADETRRQIGLSGGFSAAMGADTGAAAQAVGVEVFFTEVVGGCSCHDDPSEFPSVCRLEVRLADDGDLLVVPTAHAD